MVSATKVKGKPKPSSLDVINRLAASGQIVKGKPSKPELHDPALDEPIRAFIEHSQAEDSAKALKEMAAAQIRAAAGAHRLNVCAGAGKVLASISVNGKLTYTQTCRYSPVSEARSSALEAAFEDFDRYFKPTLFIGLKESSANNEAVLEELIDKLGADFFAEHFAVKRDLLVSDAFHTDYSTRAEVQRIVGPFIEDQTIRPYTASLKVS